MRIIIIFLCFVVGLGGCHAVDGYFEKAKHYVDATAPSAFDSGRFAQVSMPIYGSDDAITYLLSKTRGEDPEDSILACMLLVAITDEVTRQPTVQRSQLVRNVDLLRLATQLDRISTNSLSYNWAYWHATTRNHIKGTMSVTAPHSANELSR